MALNRMRNEDGTAAVEFAFIMVLLLILVFGIIEFGIAWSKVNVYTGAAREGARYAAVRCRPDSETGCTDTLIQDRVAAASAEYPDPQGVTADITCDDSTFGDPVTVSWDQDITINIPFVPGLNPATYTRHIEAVFRCE
jgi:Flp pilus assembly protein TadG